jgi:4-amino-4-deoxy-L-arabinose transferase-like glycosyltransferase
MWRERWQIGLLVSVGVLSLMVHLGGSRLWDRDETRNAGCAAEMLARSDWVVPTFNEELRDAKPVLLYWLVMISFSLFGVSEFAARFPSAFLSLGTILATYVIGRRLFNPQVGLLAGTILATSLMFEVAGHATTPDASLIFCSTCGLMVFVLATFRPRPAATGERTAPELRVEGHYFPTSWLAVVLMYAVLGVGILAKGPVGLILPTAVIGMFLLIFYAPEKKVAAWKTQSVAAGSALGRCFASLVRPLRYFAPAHFIRTCWRMRLLTATLVALAVAGPWYLLVGMRTEGAFLRGFFIDEHFGRATRAMENHSGGPWYYIVALLIGFFPWSIFATPMLIGAFGRIRRGDPWRSGYLFAICWVGVYLGLFTLAATKLPSYVTPCYPGLALLCACFLYHWTRQTTLARDGWLVSGLAVVALVGVGVAIGLPLAAYFFLPGEEVLGILGVILLLGATVCFWMMRHGHARGLVLSFAVMAILVSVSVFSFVLPRVDRHRPSFALTDMIQRSGSETQVGAFGAFEPGLVFYAGRPIRPLARGEALTATSGESRGATPPLTVAPFLQQKNRAVLITTDKGYDQISEVLPPGVEILIEVPRFFRRGKLLLLGHRNALRQATATDRALH